MVNTPWFCMNTAVERCPAERLDDPAADRVVADQRERADRDRPAELVGHRGEHARHRLGARRPGRGVGAVRVHLAVDLGHVPVDVGVRVGVRGRGADAVDGVAVQVAHRDALPGQRVVLHPAALDHEQVRTGHPLADVARGPGDQRVGHQQAVQRGDVLAQLTVGALLGRRSRTDGQPGGGAAVTRRAHRAAPRSRGPRPRGRPGSTVVGAPPVRRAAASRRRARSRCRTSLPPPGWSSPRPKKSCSRRYSANRAS